MTLLWHQLRYEQLVFWRSREAAVFVFLFPLLLFALLTAVYNGEIGAVNGVRLRRWNTRSLFTPAA